jgi:hypothetical protein
LSVYGERHKKSNKVILYKENLSGTESNLSIFSILTLIYFIRFDTTTDTIEKVGLILLTINVKKKEIN